MSADEAARARDKGETSDIGTETPEASRLSKIAAGALDVSVLAGAAAPMLLALASGGSVAAALTTIAGGAGSSRCETVLRRVGDRLGRKDSQQATEAALRDLLETESKVFTEIQRQQQRLASLESDQREDQQQIVDLLQTVIDLLQGAPAPAARSGSPSGYDPTVVPLPLLVPTAGSGSAVTTDSGSETRWTKGAEVPIGGTTYMLRGELLCETFSDTDGTYHRQASAIQSRPPRVRPSERYAWLEQVAPGGVPATTSGAQRCLTEKYELSKRLGRSPALPRTRRLVEDGTTRTLVTGWPVRLLPHHRAVTTVVTPSPPPGGVSRTTSHRTSGNGHRRQPPARRFAATADPGSRRPVRRGSQAGRDRQALIHLRFPRIRPTDAQPQHPASGTGLPRPDEEHPPGDPTARTTLLRRARQRRSGCRGPFSSRGDSRDPWQQEEQTFPVLELADTDAPTPEEGAYVQVKGEPSPRGRVTKVEGRSVTVTFEETVDHNALGEDGELEVVPNTTVTRVQRETVADLWNNEARNPHLLDVVADRQVRPLYPGSAVPTESLNDEQLEAFSKGLTVEDALLVIGPPGTGKTRTIRQIAEQVALAGERVLITSHTHRAVDNVLGELPPSLVVVRAGQSEKVEADGQLYLLDRQAPAVCDQAQAHADSTLQTYDGLGDASSWTTVLGKRLDSLQAQREQAATARQRLEAVVDSIAGPLQTTTGALWEQLQRLHATRTRLQKRTARRTRLLEQTERRRPLPGFRTWCQMRVSWHRKRLVSCRAKRAELDSSIVRAAQQVADARKHDDVRLRDDPGVKAARRAAAEAVGARLRAQNDAREAAYAACQTLRPIHSPPVTLPPLPSTTVAGDDVQRMLSALHDRLTDLLPLLVRRRQLLNDWRSTIVESSDKVRNEILERADVIAATCVGASTTKVLDEVDVDVALVDEAGQLFTGPLAFVDTTQLGNRRFEERQKAGEAWGLPGCTNHAEAKLLIELALYYHQAAVEWAVILPYRAQVAHPQSSLPFARR